MTDISRYPRCNFSKLIIIFLWSQYASGFQNAYDLMERRQYSNEPRSSVYEERYYNRDRYSTHNRSPSSVYSSVRPIGGERSSFSGNGYDNLGNGDYSVRLNTGLRDRGRTDSFRRFDTPRDYDSFRESARSSYQRPPVDSFRDTSRSYDRQPFDSFRDTSRVDSRLDLDDRLFDSRSRDSFRDSDQFDDRSLDLGSARADNFGSGVVDIPRRRFDDVGSSSQLLPSLDRRSSHPDFYRRDYFARPAPVARSGFEAENNDNKYQSAGGGKENAGLSKVGSFLASNVDQNQKKTDSGYHDNKEGTKLDVDNREKVGETVRFDKNGGNKSTVKSNRNSKKGHTTKGFAKHHHKDETGNSTTFFDESLDEGGQEDFQDLEDDFGSRKTTEIVSGKEDGRFFQEVGGKAGNFGSGLLKDNKKVEKDIVSNNNRFNNEEKFGAGQDSADRGFKTASEYLGGGVWNDPYHN